MRGEEISTALRYLLKREAVIPKLKAKEKSEVLAELCDSLVSIYTGLNSKDLIDILIERERLGSTGVGKGIAIPHGKIKGIDRILLLCARSEEGVDFDAIDGKPVHIFFLLIAPHDTTGLHLKVLARIAKLMESEELRMDLLIAKGGDEMYERLLSADEELDQ